MKTDNDLIEWIESYYKTIQIDNKENVVRLNGINMNRNLKKPKDTDRVTPSGIYFDNYHKLDGWTREFEQNFIANFRKLMSTAENIDIFKICQCLYPKFGYKSILVIIVKLAFWDRSEMFWETYSMLTEAEKKHVFNLLPQRYQTAIRITQ